jgi:flavin reductase
MNQLDIDALRFSLRRVASTVHVIAVKCADGAFFATTATAVTPVCFDPPTVLVCINKSSAIGSAIEFEETFTINVLGAHQADVAGFCAGGAPHHERESLFDPSERFGKAAVLRDAQAALICRRTSIIPHGTHLVVFGEVIEASYRTEIQPLLYLDGRYGGFRAG